MKYRIVSFDLDKTLTTGDTVHMALAKKMGKYDEVVELERQHYYGKVDAAETTRRIVKLLEGMTEKDLDEVFREITKVKDIKKTVDALHADGFKTLIISGTMKQFTEKFKEYGFEMATGYVGEFVDGVFTGRQTKEFLSEYKAKHLKEFCEQNGATLEQSIAVGDSKNDRPVFEVAGIAIAFNPTNDLSDIVNYTVKSDSLWDVYKIIKEVNQ